MARQLGRWLSEFQRLGQFSRLKHGKKHKTALEQVGMQNSTTARKKRPPTAMDPAKVQELRKQQPHGLPVVVYSFPGGKKSRKKIVVPHDMTACEFVKLVRKQCPWAAGGKIWIKKSGGRLEVPEHLLVKDLDSLKYKAADDVLYVEVLEVEVKRNTESGSEPREEIDMLMSKMSTSVQEFKMNAADLGATQQVMKATCGSRRVLEQAREMCLKHPNHVPVLVNQPESPGIPRIRKNYTVPRDMKVRSLRNVLLKEKKLQGPDTPWDKVKMLMAGNEVQDDQCMGAIYDSMVDPDDGGLQLHLELDESFESFEPFAFLSKAPEPFETLEDQPQPEPKAAFQGPSFEEVKHVQMALAEAAEAEKLREQRAQEAEIQIEELRQENEICQEELRQEMEARLTLESQVQVLQVELQSQVKTLSAAQFALSQSLEETSASQQKNLLLEERILALEAQLQQVEKAELAELAELEAIQLKVAEDQGDLVMVGWDPEGRPVISEECSQIQVLAP